MSQNSSHNASMLSSTHYAQNYAGLIIGSLGIKFSVKQWDLWCDSKFTYKVCHEVQPI